MRERWRFLGEDQARRLVAAYGSNVKAILGDARERGDLGPAFGPELTGAEVRYLMQKEWARFPDDILWRRTKLGLTMSAGGPRGAGGVHGGGNVRSGSHMYRSAIPTVVIAVFGMLFGMILSLPRRQSAGSNRGELSAKRFPRHGRRARGLGDPSLFRFAAKRMDQQMAAADGSGGAFRGHGRRRCIGHSEPGAAALLAWDRDPLVGRHISQDRCARIFRDPACRSSF